MKAFISYQRADTAMAAHALRYALQSGGHEVFIDTGSIGAGVVFRETIATHVATSNLMFVLVGPNFAVERLQEPDSVLAFEWRRARFHGLPLVTVLVGGAAVPRPEALPATLRWFTGHNALALRTETLSQDMAACVAAASTRAAEPRRAARVLWVDDNPRNNEEERRWLRPYGIVFDNVVSTGEALQQLADERYDLVITDLSRDSSSDASDTAGVDFLDQPILRRGGPPVIVYAGIWAELQREELRSRGAWEVTASRVTLFNAVLAVLGRDGAGAGPTRPA